ncbi:MAG: alpha/beta hydrolase [Prolixibacteraceae bacterium]|nr:alpha/beta hydrolase [Prolixibacteraceae bacterium]
MKRIKFYSYYFLMILFAGLFLHSCDQTDEPEDKVYDNFISNELKFEITTQEAIAKLTTFAAIMPETSLLGAVVKSDIEVHKITYKTTFKEANIQASGLVCLPKTAGDYPVLCFQNGTNTLHSEAPTENPKSDLLSILESVASMGFIVVIPDYIGFGASSKLTHPYLHAESTTKSILDMLRAVNQFGTEDDVLAKPTKDLFIFGYSQGGWATMQLQKSIEKDYSTEFNLIASSCAAGPYSIEYMNKFITEKEDYPMPYFLTYLLNSYTAIGLVTNPLSDFIQAPYAAKIPGLFDGKHSGGEINAELTTQMSTLLTTEYRTGFATDTKFAGVRSAFVANSIEPWLISTPTRLYHGANDEFIPPALSQKMLLDFKAKGVSDTKIESIVIPGVDHSLGVIPVGFQTILWFLTLKK